MVRLHSCELTRIGKSVEPMSGWCSQRLEDGRPFWDDGGVLEEVTVAALCQYAHAADLCALRSLVFICINYT